MFKIECFSAQNLKRIYTPKKAHLQKECELEICVIYCDIVMIS